MKIPPSLLRLSACLGVLVWLGAGICEQAAARAGGAGGRSSSSRSKSSSGSRSSGGSTSRSSSGSCPSCGAALAEAMGELCRCGHCQVMVNSGDFDWVLAEITQETDYRGGSRMALQISEDLEEALATVTSECPDFSRQLAEDKASNAFMQIMTALATRNPASVRRFVDDELFKDIAAMIPERDIIFNRLYLNEAVLLEVDRDGPKHWFSVGLSASMQRVELMPSGGLALLDREEQRLDYFLTMERDVDAVPEKGSLYQHQCANCGGAVGDTLDVTCQYCGTALNSTRSEWIVCGFQAN